MRELGRKPPGSEVVSLEARRKQKSLATRKQYLTPEARLAELEADQLRLVDMVLIHEHEVDRLNRRVEYLTRLLLQLASSSVSSEKAVTED